MIRNKFKAIQNVEFKDLGFGTSAASTGKRLINKDGSFNVERKGLPFFNTLNFYHNLISMSWFKFITIVLLLFIFVNIMFAFIYWIIGIQHLAGLSGTSVSDQLLDALFFSAQTITTVGYGRISPIGFPASLVAAIESLMGVLGFAIATGLLYGRFSRPVAKILFSDNAIIAPYKGITGFEFRIANKRKSELIEIEIQLIVSRLAHDKQSRTFDILKLERDKVNFLPLSWTIVHPIDESSPLYGLTKEDMDNSQAEFMILIKAFDDIFCQNVYVRSSYLYDEIIWNTKFSKIYSVTENGNAGIDLSRINQTENQAVQ